MKLIQFDGTEFTIADEALLVKPIRELFQKEKSKKKEEFWKEMSYIWFMCDPPSSYQYLINEDERAAEIKSQEGLGLDWKPSPTVIEAMKIYRRQTTTTASLLIEDMRYGLDSIRAIIRKISKAVNTETDEDATDGGSVLAMKLDKALDSMTKACDKIPDLAKKLSDAEKALAKDFATEEKARGNVERAIGEDI